MNYKDEIPEYGDIMTVDEFKSSVIDGSFIDYDGHGHPAREGKMEGDLMIYPSIVNDIPKDATHIVWFNK